MKEESSIQEIKKPNKSNSENEEQNKNGPDPDQRDSDEIIPDEILENVPEEARGHFKASLTAMMLRGTATDPLIKKLTPEHLDKIIDYSRQDDENQFLFAKRKMWFNLGYTILALAFFVFLIVFLVSDNKDLLSYIITGFGAFLAGFGAGYGYRTYKEK